MVMLSTTLKTVTLPMSRILLLLIVLTASLLATTTAHAANITVTASRNPVALDDSFHLIYEADNNVDGEPDFTPIYEHFDILNSGQSTNMRYINGNYSLKKSWDLALIAKDVGKFTIPPISFGSDVSPAIQITISNSTSPNSVSPDGQATVPAKIFLESSVDKKQGYVQSQFIYTVRLLRTVSIASASLTEPETSDPDAIIHALGEDSYQTTRNGIQYDVFERRYAIFPQKSGPLKVSPVTFEGRVNATQPRTIFDQFRMSGQLKRLRSQTVEVSVKAAPASVNLQDWLPASDMQLTEEWSGDIQQIKSGEPVTRTITIAAEGLTGVQLPDLNFAEVSGLKQYPDKAAVEDRPGTNGITGVKQFKVALIPTRAGSYTLPEITLQWWSTKTNKKEIATIPATDIIATGVAQADNLATSPTNMPAVAPSTTPDAALQTIPAVTDKSSQESPVPAIREEPYWKWLSLFFASAWLVTLVLLFKKSKSHNAVDKSKTVTSGPSVKSAIATVEKFAGKNDTHNTKTALIAWAQLAYKDNIINNLSDITEHCSSALAEEIRLLNQRLYSSEKSAWNGRNLLAAFKSEQGLKNRQQHDEQVSVLKPLYRR
jgi:hypothetical protein